MVFRKALQRLDCAVDGLLLHRQLLKSWLRLAPTLAPGHPFLCKLLVRKRLDCLHNGLKRLKDEGFACDAIEPQGAIYISAQFKLSGKTTPSGTVLENNEDIRSYLLQNAGFAVVPFAAFGVDPDDEDGWFRASVGAVSISDLESCLPRLRKALQALN